MKLAKLNILYFKVLKKFFMVKNVCIKLNSNLPLGKFNKPNIELITYYNNKIYYYINPGMKLKQILLKFPIEYTLIIKY